jgi:hypothetical protein
MLGAPLAQTPTMRVFGVDPKRDLVHEDMGFTAVGVNASISLSPWPGRCKSVDGADAPPLNRDAQATLERGTGGTDT